MSDENDESETLGDLAVSIAIVAVDTESVQTARRLRLEIEGEPEIIARFAELNVQFLQMAFGDAFTLVDGNGQRIEPVKIDPLSEDSPVTE